MVPTIPEPRLLHGVLDNAQIPHCALVVIADSPGVTGVPIFRELLRRASARDANILLVSPLHPPSTFRLSYGPKTQIVDLTDAVPGYSSSDNWDSIRERTFHALDSLPPGPVEIFIDALDMLAEDYTSSSIISLIRSLLRGISTRKAPSRLTLLLPHSSVLLPSLIAPSLSSSLTLLSPLPLPLLSSLSTSYLTPISAAPPFWHIVETALERGLADDMAYRGNDFGVGDWSSPAAGSSKAASMGVSVLVRKATGGAKAISRSIEAVTCSVASPTEAASSLTPGEMRMDVKAIDELISRNPISSIPHPAPSNAEGKGGGGGQSAHHDLGLSFNLSLTDEQRRRRGEVPLPYAHEGEGVELGWEEEEDDEDDEEI